MESANAAFCTLLLLAFACAVADAREAFVQIDIGREMQALSA
jgi:hypothetical protein